MRTLLLLFLLAPAREWAPVHWHELIAQAKLVVTGEVVRFGEDSEGRKTGILQVHEVLKGEHPGKELVLPFKLKLTWGCDFQITYEKRKYLLLIDDGQYFRLVYYPEGPQLEIGSWDESLVVFTKSVIDLQRGVPLERRLEVLALLAASDSARRLLRLSVFELVRGLPRRTLAPVLKDLRDAYRKAYPRREFERLPERYRAEARFNALVDEAEVARPYKLVDPLLEAGKGNAKLVRTLNLLTGKTCVSEEIFRAWWKTAVPRARAKGDPALLPALLKQLREGDLAERDAAANAILDLGPDVLEPLRPHAKSPDPELRARVADLLPELEILRDIRADLP